MLSLLGSVAERWVCQVNGEQALAVTFNVCQDQVQDCDPVRSALALTVLCASGEISFSIL